MFKRLLILVAICVFFTEAGAGTLDRPPNPMQDPPELKELKYRLIGPAWGGRISRVTGVPGNPNVYFAASASGGVWKSEDGGKFWKPVFDEQPISSVGSIAIAPSDPNIVYVGSGEANIRGNVAAGNGIYKSNDGGRSWQHVWKQEGQIGKMAVHPKDPDTAFAAVLGHAFGPNQERGVFRTRDGGKTWQQVLEKDEFTGASDVEIDPSNPRKVFAGLWQARRQPWTLTSGGPGSGVYVSADGGDSWRQITGNGMPKGPLGKIGIAVAPSDSQRVYALIEAEEGGLFRSDDGGENWTRINGTRELRQRAWYYSTLTVNPANPNEIWCPQVPMLRSIDGGRSFQHVEGLHHGDHHDVWIDPLDPKRLIVGNDGGIDISTNGGETWYAPPLPLCQFYHISVDSRVPFRVSGAIQDIGTAQGPSNSLSRAGIRSTDWYDVGGGEAGWVVSNPADPDIVYAGEYGGYISRYDFRTRQARNVSIYPENPSGHGAEDLKFRFQWTAPIATSPHDPQAVYHGANVLFKSVDGGATWSPISPDLTRNDRSKQEWSGGPITGDNTGVEVYNTLFAVAESPLQKDLIWAGSDDGLLHVSKDGGKSWENVTPAIPGIPEWATVSMVEPSHFDAAVAYLVVDAHRLDNMQPYLYRTADLGKSWQRIDTGLPRDVYLHAVREDPKLRGLIYVGTERGVAFSRDDGSSWNSLRLNLPTVAVHDLQVKDDSLIVGTSGRSIWIFDDLLALRKSPEDFRNEAVYLFATPVVTRWRYHSDDAGGFWGSNVSATEVGPAWSGQNPPSGAAVFYWLKEKPKGEVKLEIADSKGETVRVLSSKALEPTGSSEYREEEEKMLKQWVLPADAGVNRAVWDLRWSGAEMIPGGILDSGFPMVGPVAVPGIYTLKLTADGVSVSSQFILQPDPRLNMSAQDYQEQLSLALEIRESITELTRTVVRIRSIRKQLISRNELLRGEPRAESLVESSTKLARQLEELESGLHNPRAEIVYDILAFKGGTKLYSRLAPMFNWLNDADGAPTQGMREMYTSHRTELEGYKSKLDELVGQDLAKLNEEAKKLGLPVIYPGSRDGTPELVTHLLRPPASRVPME